MVGIGPADVEGETALQFAIDLVGQHRQRADIQGQGDGLDHPLDNALNRRRNHAGRRLGRNMKDRLVAEALDQKGWDMGAQRGLDSLVTPFNGADQAVLFGGV